MSPQMLLLVFAGLAVLILVLGMGMVAYQRRAIEQHREQIGEILAEMKRISEEGDNGRAEIERASPEIDD